MRALILHGGRAGDQDLDAAARSLAADLRARGWEADTRVLRDIPIGYCTGCFECWTTTPGLCKITDAGNDIARAWIQSDMAVLLTPVTFGGYSSELKKALDRIICLVSPFFTHIDGEVHHRPRYARHPTLLAIGWLPRPDPDEEVVFHTLVRRNALNMHAPAFASGIVHPGETGGALRVLDRLLDRGESAA